MIDRRRFAALLARGIGASLAIAGVAPAAALAGRPAARGRQRRLLVFTKSAGFEHDVVRSIGGEPSVVERAMAQLADRIGFSATITKDGERFARELAAHDAVLFYTTGDLTSAGTDGNTPMPAEARDALIQAVEDGLGFIGVHSASDTFHSTENSVDPYIAMLGGEFESHGRPQRARVTILDPDFPGMPDGSELERHGEWYAFRNLATDVHPLLRLETGSMQGDDYERDPYPVAWTRQPGSGRVFYTALGHFAEEWEDPDFLRMLEGGIQWAAGAM
jgi:hypothetical protein